MRLSSQAQRLALLFVVSTVVGACADHWLSAPAQRPAPVDVVELTPFWPADIVEEGGSEMTSVILDRPLGEACIQDSECTSDNCSNGHCAPVVVIGSSEVRYAFIPAGTFWMGSPDGECPEDYPGECVAELGRNDTETLHEVTLTGAYFMHPHEVTVGEWAELLGCNYVQCRSNDCGHICPVVDLSFDEAIAYVNELSKSEGLTPCYDLSNVSCRNGSDVGRNYMDCFEIHRVGIDRATVSLSDPGSAYTCEGYRLPTEAEWEHAYRAGTTTAFFNGPINEMGWEGNSNLDVIAWYQGNSDNRFHIVCDLNIDDPRSPNAWGLYDMPGNVNEWVFDTWDGTPYPSNAVVDPVRIGLERTRIIRGGCYDTFPEGNRAALRVNADQHRSPEAIGFRPVRSVQVLDGTTESPETMLP